VAGAIRGREWRHGKAPDTRHDSIPSADRLAGAYVARSTRRFANGAATVTLTNTRIAPIEPLLNPGAVLGFKDTSRGTNDADVARN
jgi:hypothetical protein